MYNKINSKMAHPVGFEPTSMGNFHNKINTPTLLGTPLETLTCGLLCEFLEKVKGFFSRKRRFLDENQSYDERP
jgi:hypothetical protein